MNELAKIAEKVTGLTKPQKANLADLIEYFEEPLDIVPGKGYPLPAEVFGLEDARIRQNTGTDELAPEDVMPGDIYMPGRLLTTFKGDNAFNAIPLFGWQGQIMWPMGEGIQCFSHSGVASAETGALCSSCPNNIWVDRTPPPCSSVWNWIFLAEDMSEIFFVTFKGTSMKTGNNISRLNRGRNKFASYKLYTQQEKSSKGNYYTWKMVKNAEMPSRDVKTFAKSLSEGYVDVYHNLLNLTHATPADPVAPTTVVSGDVIGAVDVTDDSNNPGNDM